MCITECYVSLSFKSSLTSNKQTYKKTPKPTNTIKWNQFLLDYKEEKLDLGLKTYTRSITGHSLKSHHYNSWLPDEMQGQWLSNVGYSLTAT